MREFFEVVCNGEHVLRTTSPILMRETARYWAREGLARQLMAFHVRDACDGKDENRTNILNASITKSGWLLMTAGIGQGIQWKLDREDEYCGLRPQEHREGVGSRCLTSDRPLSEKRKK